MVLIDKHWKPFGMKSWSITRYNPEDALDGHPPPYLVQATIHWDKIEDIREALAKGSKETGADIANYTDVKPLMWISKVTGENLDCQK